VSDDNRTDQNHTYGFKHISQAFARLSSLAFSRCSLRRERAERSQNYIRGVLERTAQKTLIDKYLDLGTLI
jgi:hypothetical protein